VSASEKFPPKPVPLVAATIRRQRRASTTLMIRAKGQGFTLFEIVIAMIIVGALAAIAIPSYRDYVEKARISKAKMEIAAIAASLKRHWDDNRQYPASLNVLGPLPNDPWNNPYQYLAIDIVPAPNRGELRKDKNLNPLNSDFDLYSMGKDGRTVKPLTGAMARDDVVRADNGRFIGLATDH
jgi:general secretion pathway protein G